MPSGLDTALLLCVFIVLFIYSVFHFSIIPIQQRIVQPTSNRNDLCAKIKSIDLILMLINILSLLIFSAYVCLVWIVKKNVFSYKLANI